MIKGTTIDFLNRVNPDGTTTEKISVPGCTIAPHGDPTTGRPRIAIHLPKSFTEDVNGSWVNYDDNYYHVIGTTAPNMAENTPTPWNRYAVAEKIY